MNILRDSKHIARKEHTCDWCDSKIRKGETYRESACVNDGFYTWKNHLECEDLVLLLKMDDGFSEGVSEQDFNDFLYEFLSEKLTAEECLKLKGMDGIGKVRLALKLLRKEDSK